MITLRDEEYAELSHDELLAIEFLVHEELAEHARRRGSGHNSLRLAIRAAGYLDALARVTSERKAEALVTRMRAHPTTLIALDRAAQVARLTDRLSA
jgi:hypothetical protein